MTKKILLAVAILVTTLSISAKADSQLDRIMERGEIIVAVADFENEPFIYEKDGKLVGLDVDLAKAIADELAVKLKVKRVSWDGLIALSWYSNYPWSKFDIAIASITIKQSRAKACDFSDWYFYTGQKIVAPKGSNYKNIFQLAGKRIAVMGGSTGYETAKELLSAQTVIYKTPEDTIEAVLKGEVDAALSDAPIVELAVKRNPQKLEAMEGMITVERYGVVLPRDSNLKSTVDDVVRRDRKSLYEKWFK